MLIRSADISDVSKLAEIHIMAWRVAYAGLMSKSYLANLNLEKRTSDWQGWISKPGPGTTLVIEDSDEIRGFCVFGPTRDNDLTTDKIGEILALNVHPDLWRCGYGKLLCEWVIDEGQSREWESMTLWTLKSNERAKLFYESFGFKSDGSERSETLEECKSELIEEVRYSKTLR